MRLKLDPMDDSLDQVVLRDVCGLAVGMLPIDAFRGDSFDSDQIYAALWRGESVEVDVEIARETAMQTER